MATKQDRFMDGRINVKKDANVGMNIVGQRTERVSARAE